MADIYSKAPKKQRVKEAEDAIYTNYEDSREASAWLAKHDRDMANKLRDNANVPAHSPSAEEQSKRAHAAAVSYERSAAKRQARSEDVGDRQRKMNSVRKRSK